MGKAIQKGSIDEAMHFLESLHFSGIKLGLDTTRKMLELVGNPELKLRFIHVAGTNGKGSVCSMLSSALVRANFKVGLFTSPHLVLVRERLRINGRAIGEEEFAEIVFTIRDKTHSLFSSYNVQKPTYFEFITVMGILYFYHEKVDIAVMEVGMGGRLDSTNVIVPILSVITNIDYDHTKPLGSDYSKIAYEKSGIIKPHVPVICGDKKDEVRRVIIKQCELCKSSFYLIGTDFKSIGYRISNLNGRVYQENKITWRHENKLINTNLLGKHQLQNTAIVYAALKVLTNLGISIDLGKSISGIEESNWPARLQVMPNNVILDVAHNQDAIIQLVDSIKEIYQDKKWNLIFAVLRDKNWEKMLDMILSITRNIYLVDLKHHRAESSEKIGRYITAKHCKIPFEIGGDVVEVRNRKLHLKNDTLVTGSLFLVGEVIEQCYPQLYGEILDINTSATMDQLQIASIN